MGIIYRARDVSLDRIVALKVLKGDLRAQPELVARFRREAQAAARLNHPNIVQIFSVGADDVLPFIAMEYIDGVPLSTIMQQMGPLPWRRALGIAEQVARALACAHEAQVIHRDIKPPNILIDHDDQAFVTDFGIAKILTVEEQLTVDGSRLGTPQYMSPERCRDGEVTAESDIYSLGVLLFQMLTGRLPFEASTSVELVRKILSEEPARVRAYSPNVPMPVERLVAYLIEKRAEERPHSSEQVCEAIAAVRAGKPLDEHTLPVSSALADFRRDDAPRPSWMMEDATTKLLPATPLARFTLRWFGTGKPEQVFGIAGGIILVATILGIAFAVNIQEDPVAIAVESLRHDMTRWQHDAALVDVESRSPSTAEHILHLEGFDPGPVMWGSGTLAFAVFQGRSSSPRQGQIALCSIRPGAKGAALAMPPAASPPDDQQPYLVFGALTGEEPRALVAAPGYWQDAAIYAVPPASGARAPASLAQWARQISPEPPPAAEGMEDNGADVDAGEAGEAARQAVEILENAERLSAAAPSAGGFPLFVSVRNEGNWLIHKVSRDPNGLTTSRVAAFDSPVTAAAASPDGRHAALVVRHAADIEELFLLDSESRDLRSVSPGPVVLPPHAFRPGASQLVFVAGPSAETLNAELFIYDYETGQQETLGPARGACWSPNGAALYLIAPDNLDRLQLYALAARSPGLPAADAEPDQLTFFTNGIGVHCAVSPDGKRIALAGPSHVGRPSVFFITL
jgi:predicted Ser/Thr protein kinase